MFKYMVTEGDLTLGGEHIMQYTDDVLLNCTKFLKNLKKNSSQGTAQPKNENYIKYFHHYLNAKFNQAIVKKQQHNNTTFCLK